MAGVDKYIKICLRKTFIVEFAMTTASSQFCHSLIQPSCDGIFNAMTSCNLVGWQFGTRKILTRLPKPT
jgi:hypothetical protein